MMNLEFLNKPHEGIQILPVLEFPKKGARSSPLHYDLGFEH